MAAAGQMYLHPKIFTACQRSCEEAMFSVVSVCHSVQAGSHVAITHDAALKLAVQGPSSVWGPRPAHVQTCS